MDQDEKGFVPREGMTVVGADGERVGDIDLVDSTYFIVRKGIFPQDYYIPHSAIASHDEDTVHLTITKDEALGRGLGNPAVAFDEHRQEMREHEAAATPDEAVPVAPEPSATPASKVPEAATREGSPEAIDTEGATREDMALPENDMDEGIIADDISTREEPGDEMHRTVELHAEELTATTRPVERGVARVQKRVVEEVQTFEVPVVEEEVVVTRRRVDKELPDADAAFTEETVEIPLRGQEVEIETQASIVEEIEVGKTFSKEVREVADTVRHEEARIERDGDNPVDPGEPDDDLR